jgi:Ser/Thr protein kinase RdoA (MazF antagonist)
VHRSAGFDFSVSPLRGGRTPELDDFEVLEWIGRFLARIHTVGSAKAFKHRPTLDVQSFALEPAEWLQTHQMIPLEVEREWREALGPAVALIEQAFAQGAADCRLIRLHGDCHPGNILWTPAELPGGGPHFVDLCKTSGCCFRGSAASAHDKYRPYSMVMSRCVTLTVPN